ncbi:unnamed protein product [Protopolystoma xenopodis]|uniref:Uncharacterized protein n=1 Tax=Protopolystoma xenopodis TaxID=117903 RepID=A0A448XGT1_9PLAT|nr:unnamed protein product [Protopolystoma xenopodis]
MLFQATVLHCRGSTPAEGVDKTNARSKLFLHCRGSTPAEGVDKTNARSKLQSYRTALSRFESR